VQVCGFTLETVSPDDPDQSFVWNVLVVPQRLYQRPADVVLWQEVQTQVVHLVQQRTTAMQSRHRGLPTVAFEPTPRTSIRSSLDLRLDEIRRMEREPTSGTEAPLSQDERALLNNMRRWILDQGTEPVLNEEQTRMWHRLLEREVQMTLDEARQRRASLLIRHSTAIPPAWRRR
jgi:hypothetical protein